MHFYININMANDASTGTTTHIPRGPPTLYCDGAAVIRRVTEKDGTFPTLRRGDHCLIPLNLARGAWHPFDVFVDFLSELDLIHFHHHMVVLDDVASLKDGAVGHVAEFTNTPADFLDKATRVGYSGAFFDKASYRRTPLTEYAGGVVYRVVPAHPLTDKHRDQIVARAQQYLEHAKADEFVHYNMAIRNCETVATSLLSSSIGSNDSDGFKEIEPSKGESPQVNFAMWNTFRFCLQCVGAVFLWMATVVEHEDLHVQEQDSSFSSSSSFSSYRWTIYFILFFVLCAVPVFLQSLVLFLTKIHHLRLMWLRGTLGTGSIRHLIGKEFFRMLLVGWGSACVIIQCGRSSAGVNVLIFGKKENIDTMTTVLVLFCYYILNFMYSVLAQVSHWLIIQCYASEEKIAKKKNVKVE